MPTRDGDLATGRRPGGKPVMLTWTCKPFDGLSNHELYAVMVLRQRVFVVEQTCPFLDADGLDQACMHLLGRAPDGTLAAYARLVPPGISYPDPAIGRVVTAPEWRGRKLGAALIRAAIAELDRLYPCQSITLGAQSHLQAFYGSFGFVPVGEPYIEDAIPHQTMRLIFAEGPAGLKGNRLQNPLRDP